MLNVRKILLPVVFTDPTTDSSHQMMQQATWLARRFDAQIIMLHVVSRLSYPYGVLESGHDVTARDLHAQVVQLAQKNLDRTLPPEFDGIAVTRVLLRGDPATEIVETARNRNVDLIVMATHGHGAFYRLLLGSVTAKVLHETQCPVWTGAHTGDAQPADFSIRRIVCSVELHGHSRHTVTLAAGIAKAVDATLTLVHITGSVESYGPGGSYVDPAWKKTIVGSAVEEVRKLQHDVGTNFEAIIESGNVTELLNRVAERTKADVLIIGHIPGRSHLGDNGNGYGIIRQSQIPVLSV